MAYHIITGKQFDLNLISTSSDKGLRPRHAIVDLAAAMDAKVHFPSGRDLSVIDKLRGRILGNPDAWALARRVVGREILDGDVVYCTGEDIGVPIASTCAQRGIKARIAVFVHNLDRPRSRFGLRLFGSAKNISLFIACSRHQIDFLMNHLQVAQEKLLPVWDSIDTEFFTPGAIKRDKPRPLIVAAGLEKRDYRTLAEATKELDVDVRITGFSDNAKIQARAFPNPLPQNMKQDFYEWTDLVQLYRDADIVVVSTFPSTYASGVQSLMEGMACARPIIATQTLGLREYAEDASTVLAVSPGNASEMRGAIERMLAEKEFANELAKAGHTRAKQFFDQDKQVAYLTQRLRSLGEGESDRTD